MQTIQAKPLTETAFRKYGTYLNLLDDEALAQASIFPGGFFADVVPLEFGPGNPATVSVCQVKMQEKNLIRFLEAHSTTGEGLLPLDGDVVIYVGVPVMGPDKLSTETLEAFRVPKGTFVKLNPLIIHGPQYSVSKEEVHVVCLLPGRTFQNDMLMKRLEEPDYIEVLV